MKKLYYFSSIFAITILLCGCPPSMHCSIVNRTRATVKIDFEYEGNGALLPHFELAPNSSRDVSPGRTLIARRLDGRVIGKLDLSGIKLPSPYYNSRTQTFNVAIEESGIVPAQGRE